MTVYHLGVHYLENKFKIKTYIFNWNKYSYRKHKNYLEVEAADTIIHTCLTAEK